MKTSIYKFTDDQWMLHPVSRPVDETRSGLVICFSGKSGLNDPELYPQLHKKFPAAHIAFCSTAGEIFHENVLDHSQVLLALEPEHTRFRAVSVNIRDFQNSFDAAVHLGGQLKAEDLAYILILSDGSLVNGSELVKGFNTAVPQVLVTGGLAGDGPDFRSTLVGLDGQPEEGAIVAIGFYGTKLLVTHGSQAGWNMFGVEKEITKSEGNVLYEIDHKNALEKYKEYLGPDAENLPGSALLFPLAVTEAGSDLPLVRTILSIDEKNNSMTFAGDVPEGSKVRFMRTNLGTLTGAAAQAASYAMEGNRKPDLALLISCVGRKLVLGPRIEQEVEAVSETLGGDVPLAGFYSYGEISPFNESGKCQFHNQTMTVTAFYELS